MERFRGCRYSWLDSHPELEQVVVNDEILLPLQLVEVPPRIDVASGQPLPSFLGEPNTDGAGKLDVFCKICRYLSMTIHVPHVSKAQLTRFPAFALRHRG